MNTNRRDFIGGLLATAALPVVADGTNKGGDSSRQAMETFGRRGQFERLNLALTHVHLGLAKPFSVLHIADTHLTAAYPDEPDEIQKLHIRRTKTFGGMQERALADSLAWARQNVEFVIHTGDLVDWYSRANFDLAKKYYGEGLSKTSCLGNHEYQYGSGLDRKFENESHKDTFRPKLKDCYPFDLKLQSTVAHGVNFVTMDNVFGAVTEEQRERFRGEVAKGLPIVLAMHVPFFTEGIRLASDRFWGRCNRKFDAVPPHLKLGCGVPVQCGDPFTASFIGELRRERLLKCILTSHLHFSFEERFSETAMQYIVGGNFLFQGREVLFT